MTPARGGIVVDRVVPAHLACRIGARARAGQRDAWPAVVAIALGSFALVFSEVIPVGLLADISGHLRVSVGTGGLMVVVPAAAAAVAAPLLTLCSARLERRAVLVGLSALVLVSDVIAGLAPARASALRWQAPQIRSASRAGKRRYRRQARLAEQETPHNDHAEGAGRGHTGRCQEGTVMPDYQEGTVMPNAVVMTGYGPPEVLEWAEAPLPEPGEGQIRIKVKAAGISPTDLALRAGYLKAFPLPPDAVLGFEAAGTVDAAGPGVTGTSVGEDVTALLLGLGGYAEYAVASIWIGKPESVSWSDAAALPSSAEAAARVLRQLDVHSGETLLLFGGGGSVGIIATQLAVARGVTVISAVGEHDETLARELGATPVRYGPGVADRVRAFGAVDAVFDAAGKGVLADAVALAGGPKRVITLSDPTAADFGVTLSEAEPDHAPDALDETMTLLADGKLRLRAHQTMPMPQAAEAHRQLESGAVHERIILTL